jgi:alpha-2-macroglobulin
MQRALLVSLVLLSGLGLSCSSCSKGGEQAAAGSKDDRRFSLPPPPPSVTPQGPGSQQGRPLAVVASRPQGVLAGLERLTLTFNKPVVALAALEEAPEAGEPGQGPAKAFTLEPKAKGRWRWLGSASVEFVPEGPLPYSTQFTLDVPAGLQALDGSKLQEPFALRFTTPVAQVTAEEPSSYECRYSEPKQAFRITLNQPIEGEASAFFFEAGGKRIAASVTKSVNLQEEQRELEAKAAQDPAFAKEHHIAARRFARADPQQLAYANQQTRYELVPAQPLPLDTAFTLRLGPGTHGKSGPLPMRDWKTECRVYGPARVAEMWRCSYGAEHCSRGPVYLRFATPLGSVAELKKRLSITPSVPLEWDEQSGDEDLGADLGDLRTQLRLHARWSAGQTYTVKLAAGAVDKFGQQLPAFEGTVQLDDLMASVYVGRELALLEAAGDGQLPVQVTNTPALAYSAWPLTPQQYLQLRYCMGGSRCSEYPAAAPEVKASVPLSYPKNESRLHGLDVRGALKGARSGLLALQIQQAPDLDGRTPPPHRVLAQLTDVIVHAKIGAAGGAAWVTSAQTGQPLEGAKVVVYSSAGQPQPEVVTDKDGLATLPPIAEIEKKPAQWEAPKLLVAATYQGDTGVVTLAWDDQLRGEVAMGLDAMNPRAVGEVFADRGIYRPGDLVHLKALLRRLAPGTPSGLSTPSGQVKFTVSDPEGQALAEKTVAITAYGTAALDFTLPKEGRLGWYSVAAQLASDKSAVWNGSFNVAEYRAPQFRVDVLTGSKDALAGSKPTATVSARYLFGGAMTGAKAQWSVVRSTTEFAPPNHGSYTFGRQTWLQNEDEPQQYDSVFATGEGVVDAQGNLALSLGAVEAIADRAADYSIEAQVQDVSRQTVAGRAHLLVHPAAFYLGLGKQSLFAESGKPYALPVAAVQPDGTEVAGVGVKVSALLRSWHSVRKKGVGGVYQSVSEPIDEVKGTCEAQTQQGGASCGITLSEPGFYTLRAEAKDKDGHLALSTTGVYVLGPGFAAWQRGDSARIELVPDKSEYAVGEVAHVLVKSPYPECLAMVSVEREGVREKRVQKLIGTATAIDVPITEEMVPNVFVGAVLQRKRVEQGGLEPGDDPGRPSVRAGYAELSVGRAVKRLSVQVSVPNPEWRPRQKVPVQVLVKDAKGQPRKAEVALYTVDEAVLRLTDYKTPDPVDEMFPHRSLGVALGEPLLSLVRRQRFGEKGEVQPGGGGGRGGGNDLRSKFVTTPLWTTLETNADGLATAEVELPDNLTTFRIMAVALTPEDRFGSGETSIRVSLPLLVLPALPRLARTGDAFEAGVVLNAKGLAAQQSEVKVTATLEGPVVLAQGQPAEQTVTALEGVAREVRFRFVAAGAGTARLVFRATAEGEPGRGGPFSDAVEQKLPVQRPVEIETVATYGETVDQVTEGLAPPKDAQEGVGGLTVSLSSSSLGGLGEGFKQLIDYPYGCLEQLSSRLIPFVALREVQQLFLEGDAPKAKGKKGRTPLVNEEAAKRAADLERQLALLTGREPEGPKLDPDEVVRDTVAKIARQQQPSGGFTYWAGEGCAYAWPSIYATLALHRASEAGYRVDKSVLDAAKRFVARKAEGQAACPWERVGLETRAFALQVLARMGEPRPAFYDELYVDKAKLPLFGKALLADAILVGNGKRPQAEVLLQEILDRAQETPGEAHFAETDADTYAPLFSSDARTTGMVLQTLVDFDPSHPFVGKIVRYFKKSRGTGAFRNTQEAAYALMGLTEVVRVRERAAPDFNARVTLAGKELLAQRFQGRSLDVITKTIPLAELKAALGGEAKARLNIGFDGTGLLTYGAVLRYAPSKLPEKALDEGLFVQRWLEPYAEPGKVTGEFNAGELVRVRVRLATRMERHFVALSVPLPAGLEAVDLGFATSAQQPLTRGPAASGGEGEGEGEEAPESGGEEGYDDRGAGAYGFWSPFNHSEKRDDRVLYFSDELPPGVHVVSFVARATTPGRFLLLPAKAEEMYSPEVFGRSEGSTVVVAAQKPVTLAEPAAAK